jgi:NAD(P)-dependent dehydrogenase (short-subunit alcohol dehydrogenase family)
MNRLQDRVAVVTGAASGIGQASACAMAAAGARVVAGDIDLEGAQRTVERIRQAGGEATALPLDAMQDESIAALIRKSRETYGAIHVLHNNVGGTDSSRDRSITEMDWSYWNKTIQLNLNSTAYATRCVLPIMIEGGGGSIINTTSAAALQGDVGPTGYSSAKGAVISFTLRVAAQYGKQGIRCNVIAPGMILSHRDTPRSPALLAIFERHNLVPYHGRPEDIANTAVFLASEESRFITGQCIVVDGGLGCHSPATADLVELSRSGASLFPPPGAKT